LTLRTRERAVTATDFEHLALTAAPDVARVKCTASSDGQPAGVRVLVVPRVEDGPDGFGRLRYAQLQPGEETRRRIVDHLDARRLVGVDMTVGIPVYRGVSVVTSLQAMRRAAPDEVKRLALDALYAYFHPVIGGPGGDGWPFGRPIQAGEVHSVLQLVPGVDFVDKVELYAYTVDPTAPDAGRRGTEPLQRIDVPPDGLVFSFGHDVRVEHRP
jgi:predicted phage baseplate assembly protein